MELLEKKIQESGRVLPGNILKVDNFLNHMIDVELFDEMGKEFYNHFKSKKIDKIITIEVSGIGLSVATARYFKVPVLYAKKTESKTLSDNCYVSQVYSYTKATTYNIRVDKNMLTRGEHVLIIDDFLANGKALEGLIDIADQAGVVIEGIGIAIEKGFQQGGTMIRDKGYEIQSLAIVDSLDNNKVTFRQQ